MPPVKKLDLVPDELKKALRQALSKTGYGDIEDVTGQLNAWLKDEGIDLKIGKTAVGKYAQLLKDQRAAYEISEALMTEIGIDQEASMHKAIMQMIAAQCVNFMMKSRDDEEGEGLGSMELMRLAKMLKDLMASAGIREKIAKDERDRIRDEAREEAANSAATAAKTAGLSADTADWIRNEVLGLNNKPEPEAA